ncbi:homeobox protein knotted-1-like 1 [Rosa sericea]
MAENTGTNVRVVTSSDEQGDDRIHVGQDEGDDQDEDKEEEALKKMISGHPLYGLLLENHLNCLKVCLGDEIGAITGSASATTSVTEDTANNKKLKAALTNPSSSDLDQFTEAYCKALKKLKEAMDNPLKEASSFINSTYTQLEEITKLRLQGNRAGAKPD